jgi:drug/metabolite transporter (DMT)-like permease
VPIFNAVLAPFLLPSERRVGIRIVGLSLGFVGVGVPDRRQPTVTGGSSRGTLAVVVASISYAVAGFYAQRRHRHGEQHGAGDGGDGRRRGGAAAARAVLATRLTLPGGSRPRRSPLSRCSAPRSRS